MEKNPLKVAYKKKQDRSEAARLLWETVLKPKWTAKFKAEAEEEIKKLQTKKS